MTSAELTIVLAAAMGVFGLLIGSFLNVVIYRVPSGLSIVSPPSACPNCGVTIAPRDNIPVLSWLLLGARCRGCARTISARYPLVELGTGLAFAGVAAWVLLSTNTTGAGIVLQLVAYLYLAAISIALALIDLDTHRLPNAIVLPSYLVAVVLLAASALLGGTPGVLLLAGIGGVALGAFYLILAFIYPAGMGLGDVKLAGVLGLYLGFLGLGSLLVGAFAAFLLGGLYALGLIIAKRADRKSGIPFGPWMLGGAWLGIFAGEWIWRNYLALLGL